MSRTVQPEGGRGSLKWIQRAVNERWPALEEVILARIGPATGLEWRSPLAEDSYAEYRDAEFLERLGVGHLTGALKAFWPARGPQWDALGLSDRGDLLLVEAKAHVGEMCSSATASAGASLARITERLDGTAGALGARADRAPWPQFFYQLANRLSHLHFLREQGQPAWLVLVNFLNDRDMYGPTSPETWRAAYDVAFHVMGLPHRHPLSRYIIEVFPDVDPAEDRKALAEVRE
jgi:hypothetical protein